MNRNGLLGILAAAVLVLIGGCVIQQTVGKRSAAQPGQEAQEEVFAETKQAAEEELQDDSVPDPYVTELFAMDTVMVLTVYGDGRKEAMDAAKAQIQWMDELLSTGNPDSEVSTLNANGGGEVSEHVANLLSRAVELYQKTDGVFDFTIYPVMELWGFPTQDYQIPTAQELADALALVDGSQVELEEDEETETCTVSMGDGQKLDFGGIGKGYTSDWLMEIFQSRGISSAIVSLGGNVQVLGSRPDGIPWRIGIQDPTSIQGEILGSVSVTDQAVITSGGYERYFEEDGQTYIHIIDPGTGRPVENELDSVTIVSADGTLADALSTTLFIMGMENGSDYWRESEDPFEAIFVKKDGSVAITEGLADSFRTERDLEIIRR